MKNTNIYSEDHWVFQRAMQILRSLGYDTDGETSINEQFIEKYKDELTGSKKRIYGKRKRTTKKTKD